MKNWGELRSLPFIYVTDIMGVLFEVTVQANRALSCLLLNSKRTCAQLRALWKACLCSTAITSRCIWTQGLHHVVNFFFFFFFGHPVHNNASFALFLPLGVDGGGGVAGARFYCYCSMLSARARPRMWMWPGTISGFRDVDIATSQITTALISAKIMPKRLFLEGGE